jgi:hypothetical protein
MDNHLRLEGLNQMARHGRTCSGHPHLLLGWNKDVDDRHKGGHDD